METEAQFNDSKIPEKRHCRDCSKAGWDPDGNYCGSKESLAQTMYGRACHVFRRKGEPCGPEGKLFIRIKRK